MAPELSAESSPARSSSLLVPGPAVVLYCFGAAAGMIVMLNGIHNYQVYAVGGIPDPMLSLIGVVVTLSIGFT